MTAGYGSNLECDDLSPLFAESSEAFRSEPWRREREMGERKMKTEDAQPEHRARDSGFALIHLLVVHLLRMLAEHPTTPGGALSRESNRKRLRTTRLPP
jgi:hypothetical protein